MNTASELWVVGHEKNPPWPRGRCKAPGSFTAETAPVNGASRRRCSSISLAQGVFARRRTGHRAFSQEVLALRRAVIEAAADGPLIVDHNQCVPIRRLASRESSRALCDCARVLRVTKDEFENAYVVLEGVDVVDDTRSLQERGDDVERAKLAAAWARASRARPWRARPCLQAPPPQTWRAGTSHAGGSRIAPAQHGVH